MLLQILLTFEFWAGVLAAIFCGVVGYIVIEAFAWRDTELLSEWPNTRHPSPYPWNRWDTAICVVALLAFIALIVWPPSVVPW